MPQVIHGIPFNDEDARQQLLGSHAGVIALSIVAAICQLVVFFVARGVVSDYQQQVGTETGWRSRAGGGGSEFLSLAITMVILIGVPGLVYFFLRQGLQKNSAQILQGICLLDGYCAYCSLLGVLTYIQGILTWNFMSSTTEEYQCQQDGISHPDGTFQKYKDDFNQEKCETTLTAVADIHSVILAVNAIGMIICICNAGICAFATMQANTAHSIVKQGKAFVGTPAVVMMATNPGQPAVIGQPAIVMGQPVIGTPIREPC